MRELHALHVQQVFDLPVTLTATQGCLHRTHVGLIVRSAPNDAVSVTGDLAHAGAATSRGALHVLDHQLQEEKLQEQHFQEHV